MEPPSSFDADAVRDEKVKVLKAIRPMTPEEVLRNTVRGQYGERGRPAIFRTIQPALTDPPRPTP